MFSTYYMDIVEMVADEICSVFRGRGLSYSHSLHIAQLNSNFSFSSAILISYQLHKQINAKLSKVLDTQL